jgi:hypothetical protein
VSGADNIQTVNGGAIYLDLKNESSCILRECIFSIYFDVSSANNIQTVNGGGINGDGEGMIFILNCTFKSNCGCLLVGSSAVVKHSFFKNSSGTVILFNGRLLEISFCVFFQNSGTEIDIVSGDYVMFGCHSSKGGTSVNEFAQSDYFDPSEYYVDSSITNSSLPCGNILNKCSSG